MAQLAAHTSVAISPSRALAGANIDRVDVFRGVAALAVAALHVREVTWIGFRAFWHATGFSLKPDALMGYLSFPLVWGSIGVPIFFVLSGYCIHRSQAFRKQRNNAAEFSTANFLFRRFCRIYPVLVFALIVTFACDYICRHFYAGSDKLGNDGIALFLVNLFSVQGIAGPAFGSNGALWTLSLEVQFYLFYPVLLLALNRFGKMRMLAAITTITAISYFVLERHGVAIFTSYYFSWYLGVMLAEYEAEDFVPGKFMLQTKKWLYYAISGGLLMLGCAIFFVQEYLALQIWALSFAVFAFAILRKPATSGGVIGKVFNWLGLFSFSIYIIHLPVAVLIHSAVFGSVHQNSLVPFLLTMSAIVALAYAFHCAVERPALALSKRFRRF